MEFDLWMEFNLENISSNIQSLDYGKTLLTFLLELLSVKTYLCCRIWTNKTNAIHLTPEVNKNVLFVIWTDPFIFSTHRPLYPFSISLQIFSSSAFLQCHTKSPSSPPILHPIQLLAPPPLYSSTQPRVVYVQRNLGLRTKLSWLFLLWGGSPLSVVTAAKYVMFSFSMPKHAPSKLIDGKIILGGIEGWGKGEHTRDRAGPWGQEVWSAGWACDDN